VAPGSIHGTSPLQFSKLLHEEPVTYSHVGMPTAKELLAALLRIRPDLLLSRRRRKRVVRRRRR
jgi:hypothetical protein